MQLLDDLLGMFFISLGSGLGPSRAGFRGTAGSSGTFRSALSFFTLTFVSLLGNSYGIGTFLIQIAFSKIGFWQK